MSATESTLLTPYFSPSIGSQITPELSSEISQQPPYLRTAHVLATLGIPAPAAKLPEDLFFLTFQKAWCIVVTLLLWRKVVGPLFSATSEPVTSTRTTRAKDA